jgi:N-acetylglucosaminyldiphosphoundecaprenol N-acetyl-beta-D-mannosaminyltransferase
MKENQNSHRYINMNISRLFHITFFNGSKNELVHQYIKKILEIDTVEKTTLLFTPNPEQVIESSQNAKFLRAVQSADVCIPDGIGVVLASKYCSLFDRTLKPLRERITGIDVMKDIVTTYPAHSCAVIGGHVDDDPLLPRKLVIDGIEVAWLPAYADASAPTKKEQHAVETFLKQVRPEVVFVAFGAPKQEYWAMSQREALAQHGVKLVMVVGGSVDVFSGRLQRAPELVRRLGLEWLYRLMQEPWRWRRQLRLLSFVALALREPFRRKA